MPMLLLLGGARSGKSSLAQVVAARAGQPVTLIATAEALDDEMQARIARHRSDRPSDWTTVEEPLDLSAVLRAVPKGEFVIVDCLTLWVSNMAGLGRSHEQILDAAATAADGLAARVPGAVVVSNEVGLGIVPANPAARAFRDTLGSVNATFAARADRALLLVAGRAHELRSTDRFLEGIPWLQPRQSST